MTKYPEYCVAIRTLGTAGDAYQRELDALAKQSVQPKRILVYIAEGYALPKETIGRETYIRCPKGMMTQRSLPFDEVDCDWILFLDDDIYLPEDGVKTLFDELIANQGDCIAPDIFEPAKASLYQKTTYATLFQTLPHTRSDWAFIVRKDGGNSYNPHPKRVLLTQSAPGACCLCRKSAYKAVNMAAEQWIDSFGFAYGDDLLWYYKLYRKGFRVFIHFESGIQHINAMTSHKENAKQQNQVMRTLGFVNWYRVCYSAQTTRLSKLWCATLYTLRTTVAMLSYLPFALLKRKLFYFTNMVLSTPRGLKYVRSAEYKSYPSFYD